jgi:hypothetical protein
MRRYHQLTSEERYALSALRKQGYSVRGIAGALDRAPSTISREIQRNRRKDGGYRPYTADERARGRRSRSRRNRQFPGGSLTTPSDVAASLVSMNSKNCVARGEQAYEDFGVENLLAQGIVDPRPRREAVPCDAGAADITRREVSADRSRATRCDARSAFASYGS